MFSSFFHLIKHKLYIYHGFKNRTKPAYPTSLTTGQSRFWSGSVRWNGSKSGRIGIGSSEQANRTNQPVQPFSFTASKDSKRRSSSRFQQQQVPASKRSVLQTNPPPQRPSSNNRSASRLLPTSPSPPHTQNTTLCPSPLSQLHSLVARLSTVDKLVKLKS